MRKSLPTYFYILLFCALVVANYTIYKDVLAPSALEVSVYEAGKGTAALIRAPSGRALLVDTGTDASILRALGTSLPMWHRSLDAIILTSDSSKSGGGLADVQSRYHIAQVIHADGHALPYGTPLISEDISLTIIAPQTFTLSFGSATLLISSSTPAGTYVSNRVSFRQH